MLGISLNHMHTKTRSVIRWSTGRLSEKLDQLAPEEPLEIRLGGVPIAVVMRTPGEDRDLIRGFLLTEGILVSPEELEDLEQLDEHRWEVTPTVPIDPEQFRRSMFASSSCGVCGKASIDAVRVSARPLPEGPWVSGERVLGMMKKLSRSQPRFEATGGLHAAGLFSDKGELIAVREDVGRHNAVDKVIGSVAREEWPLPELVLGVSGRLSFEITQKAAVGGISMVVGISAASSLAAELAEELGMTLIGFVRDDTMVIYSGVSRVV